MATGEAAVGGGPEKPDPDRVLVHDFRNLLAVIVNYCELIAAETTDPEAIKADVAEIRIAAERRDDEWVFSIRDNGIGFLPEHADRVFKLFQRLHGRGEYPGNGIGLSVCKRIVERHGGRIWADSEPGRGSTFCFTLPFADPQDTLVN